VVWWGAAGHHSQDWVVREGGSEGAKDSQQAYVCPIDSHCSEKYSDCRTSNVKGNLKKNVQFWKDTGANPDIVNCIENGYTIPFPTTPEQSVSCNNKSALLHSDFVKESVDVKQWFY